MTFRYLDYETSREIPNIVVDGSPNEATVLSLSHWPGTTVPAGLARDLSAEIAFAYLDDPPAHPPVDVVTNNHFDQDGIVAIHTLVEPELSNRHRDLLIDVAAAGDFATYRDRRAARASMTLARLASNDDDTCSYDESTDRLYRELLPQLLSIVLDNHRYRDLWADEDEELTSSERAIDEGRVVIDERLDLDLAVVTIPENEPIRHGHRFGHERVSGIHPMAIHNATERFRILTTRGRRYHFADRYETWVQYQSRPTFARVDLRPIAAELTALESGTVTWRATSPDQLTPELTHDGESSIEPARLEQTLAAALSTPAVQ